MDVYLYQILAVGIIYITLKMYARPKGLLGVVGNVMGYFPTIVHEFGHVIGCKAMLGRVDNIVLVHTRKNQERHGAYGYAVTYNQGRIARAFKTYLGYVFPPLVLFIFIYLNSVEMVSVAFLMIIIGSIYLIVKTSNKVPVMANMVVMGVITYLVTRGGLLEGYDLIIISIIFSMFIGLLLGETLFSMINMIKLLINKDTTWDGYVIKKAILMPVTLTILMWYVINGYLIYQTVLLV